MARRIRILAISALATTALTSCASVTLFEQETVEYFEDLGSVHVTLFDPVPFEQYKENLQPTFKLDEAAALNAVIPVTQFQDQSRFAGSSVGISVVGPTKTNTVSETSSEQTTGDSTTSTSTIEKTKGRISATPPDVTPGDPAQRKTAAQQSAVSPKALGEQAPVDPFLKYWTAAALYQEVQLLNNFWKNLAQNDRYAAYIVRTQIATLPLLRNAPYDAIVDLSFWTKGNNSAAAPKVIPLVVTDNLESQSRKLTVEQVREIAVALKGMSGLVGIGAGINDYDQLLRSVIGRDINSLLTVARLDDSVLRVRLGALQQAGSAYAMVPRTHTITTLLLVPTEEGKQLSDSDSLHINSYARFVDTRTGKSLASLSDGDQRERYRARVNRVLQSADIAPLNDDQVRKLIEVHTESQGTLDTKHYIRALLQGQNGDVDNRLSCPTEEDKAKGEGKDVKIKLFGQLTILNVPPPRVPSFPEGVADDPSNCPTPGEVKVWRKQMDEVVRSLKPRIAALIGDSPYDASSSPFPSQPKKTALCVFDSTKCPGKASEPVMLLDDGGSVKVSIAGLGKPIPSQVDVLLHAVEQGGKKREIVFPASSTATDAKGSGLQLEFPSLIPWSLHGEKVDRKISMHWIDANGIRSDTGVDFSNTKYEAAPGKAPINAKMVKAQGSEQIAQKDTKGDLWLTFSGIEKNKDKIYLSITNARIEKTVPEKAIDVDNKYQVTKDGTVQLKLGNLAAATKVVLKLYTEDKRESAPLEVSVK